MLDDFADALAEADAVAVANIWASRDPDTSITSAAGARGRRARAPAGHHRDGAGDRRGDGGVARRQRPRGRRRARDGRRESYRIAELLLEHLADR